MRLRLEAISVPDGVGIVRSGQTLRLARPPYLLINSPVISEDSLQEAILKAGFSASNVGFQNWEELIRFLNSKVVEYRERQGRPIPNSISPKDIIDMAPPEVVNGFLERVESELIPQHHFDHAEAILLAVLSNQSLLERPMVLTRATQLLRLIKEARDTSSHGIETLARRDLRFPSLIKHNEVERSDRLARAIETRGCVFVPAS